MTEYAQPIFNKLREAEDLTLAILRDESKAAWWIAAAELKLAIWRALGKASDLARIAGEARP